MTPARLFFDRCVKKSTSALAKKCCNCLDVVADFSEYARKQGSWKPAVIKNARTIVRFLEIVNRVFSREVVDKVLAS